MKLQELKQRLAQEAYEYLTDLRNLTESLRRAEGWVTLGLVLAVVFMVAVWFITAMGFDRLSQVANSLGQTHGRVCRPIGDMAALVIMMDAVTMALLAVLALGEMMRLLDRIRRRERKDSSKVSIPAGFMLAVGTAGIIYMRIIC